MTEFAKGGLLPQACTVVANGTERPELVLGPPRVYATTAEGAALLAKLNQPTPVPAEDGEDWTCGRCDRGQCACCVDPDCSCCTGNPEDLSKLPGGLKVGEPQAARVSSEGVPAGYPS